MNMKWIRRIIDYTKGEVKRKLLEYYESKLAKLARRERKRLEHDRLNADWLIGGHYSQCANDNCRVAWVYTANECRTLNGEVGIRPEVKCPNCRKHLRVYEGLGRWTWLDGSEQQTRGL